MDYLITSNKTQEADSMFKRFVEKLNVNREIIHSSYHSRKVYLISGDKYVFITNNMLDNYKRGFRGEILSDASLYSMLSKYNPYKQSRF